MAETNRQLLLAAHPVGRIRPTDYLLVEAPVPEPGDGQVLVRTKYLSLDPTNRIWASGMRSYLPPVKIGEVMRSVGLGVVEKSRHPAFSEGMWVTGPVGWQDHAAVDGAWLAPMVEVPGVTPENYLAIAPHIALTAYFGLLDVGQAQPGETVVVSAAAGAVGSLVGQMARLKGMTAVGIAGGADKCAYLRELGFDGVVDYKHEDVSEALKRTCPNGIDVYFDNVGGDILDAVLARMNLFGRVALCGLISTYNATAPVPGPYNFAAVLTKRLRIQGFIVFDYYPRAAEAYAEIGRWVGEGRLRFRVDVVEGLEQIPTAVNKLFDGTNTGKLIVRV
jgi:NADPH-dependent curcumin reductase CurA